jgi:multicomponent Na+:H+ antiporter subunit D
MMAAMAIASGLCIFIGCYTPYLYLTCCRAPVEYHPYTSYHVSETLEMLLFTALGFFLLVKKLGPRRRSASTSTGSTGRAAAASYWLATQAVQCRRQPRRRTVPAGSA